MVVTLYHGSREGIDGEIRPDRSRESCDFGRGFYLAQREGVMKPAVEMPLWKLDLCSVEGRLLELAKRKGYPSARFVAAFMKSKVAEQLDHPYNRYQWAGEEYLLECVVDECGLKRSRRRDAADPDALFWMGYTYRYWHHLTGETSRAIYAIADYDRMRRVYRGYHTVSCELAIEWLKERRQPSP